VKRGKVLSHQGRSTATQKAVPEEEEEEKYSSCNSGKEEKIYFDIEKRPNFRTFCKHKVEENNDGCVQNVVRTAECEEREERQQLLGREVDQGRRRRRTSDSLHEQFLGQEKRRKGPLTWRSGRISGHFASIK
jgi:hypothetical protein